MKADTPEDFVKRNSLKHSRSGSEWVIDCPMCSKEQHLFINSKTFLWNCKRCDARGNESSLKKALGLQYDIRDSSGADPEAVAIERMAREMRNSVPQTDVQRWQNALVNDQKAEAARQYLLQRGIPDVIRDKYMLGWSEYSDGASAGAVKSKRTAQFGQDVREDSTGWIVIPAFTSWKADGSPKISSASVVKMRSVPPQEKSYRRLVGGDSVLYSPNGINHATTLLIVGGEIDALSVVVAGWDNVISPTTGEASWSDGWTAQLEQCDDIVIIYDNDDAGRKGAAALSDKLGAHRVRIGSWPNGCKDANECLMSMGGSFDVKMCVEKSRQSGLDSIVRIDSIRDAYKQSLRSTLPRGLSTGWVDLDNLMGGVRDGEVTLVTGDTSSGKTTFASQWSLQMASQGIKTIVCPFEMGMNRQLNKWVRQWSQKSPDTLNDHDLDSTLDSLQALPLWVLDRYGSIRIEPMRNTLMYSIRRLGVKFVLIDHIHYMIEEGPNERAEIDQMMKMMAEIAVDTGVHIVIVAHPRQHHSSDEKHRDNRIVQMSDLKGSSGLKQVADNILSVWRPRKADRSGVVASGVGISNIYMLKARSDYAVEGAVSLKFILEAARYEPPDQTMAAMFADAMSGGETFSNSSSEQTERPRRIRTQATSSAVYTPTSPSPHKKRPADIKHWTEVEDDT